MTHMFRRICFAIINSESWPCESSRQISFLNIFWKGGLRYLMQSLTHGIITRNLWHYGDSRMKGWWALRNWSFMLLPILLLPSILMVKWRDCPLLVWRLLSLSMGRGWSPISLPIPIVQHMFIYSGVIGCRAWSSPMMKLCLYSGVTLYPS